MSNIFPFELSPEQLQDPVLFAEYFLDCIKQAPGRKIGIIGEPVSGTTLAMHYITLFDNMKPVYDPRLVPDTINAIIEEFDNIKNIIVGQLPTWIDILKQFNTLSCAGLSIEDHDASEIARQFDQQLISDPSAFNLLKWEAAFSIFCLRDYTVSQATKNSLCIYELPAAPINYNQYFDKLILLRRRPDWLSSSILTKYMTLQVPYETDIILETNKLNAKDTYFKNCCDHGQWLFDKEILNDGTDDELEEKLITSLANY
jgi:hypothetical protein